MVALGTVQLGLDYGISNGEGQPSLENSFKILDRALKEGITCWDTAHAYGESEAVIGAYLKKRGERAQIITKIPPAQGMVSREALDKFFKESLSRLQTENVYGLMFHSYGDFINNLECALEFLQDLKREGKIIRAGVSVYTEEEARSLMDFKELDMIQAPMNLFDTDLYTRGTLDELSNRGFDIYIRSVFLQGLFFLKEEHIREKIPEALEFTKKLETFCRERGLIKEDLALSFIHHLLGDKGKILFGVHKEDQIGENLNKLQKVEIDGEIRDFVLSLSQKIPAQVKNPSQWRKK